MGIIAGGGLPGDDEGRGAWLRWLVRAVFMPQGSSAPKGSHRARTIAIWAVVIAVIVVPLALRRL